MRYPPPLMPAPVRPTEPHLLLESSAIAEGQQLLIVEGGPAAAEYTAAGQVVEVEGGGQRAYAVIASPLSERPRLAFVLRRGAAVMDLAAATPVGGTVSMTRPFGPGFRIERAAGRSLWMCVAGTGIAAVRPVLHELAAAHPSLAGTHLLYGVKTSDHVAFSEELLALAARGLSVRVCLSDQEPSAAWERAGWVQTILAAEKPDLSGAAMLVAGPHEMVTALEAVAADAGMPPEMLLRNF